MTEGALQEHVAAAEDIQASLYDRGLYEQGVKGYGLDAQAAIPKKEGPKGCKIGQKPRMRVHKICTLSKRPRASSI